MSSLLPTGAGSPVEPTKRISLQFSRQRAPAGKGAAGGRKGRGMRDQRGMVTVELAIGVVAVLLLTTVLVGIVALGIGKSACQTVSADLARQLARGDQEAAERIREAAPEGAKITVAAEDEGVRVKVQAPVRIFGIGPVQVMAESWARFEPGVGP